ncbi:Protein CBG08856 [Caenorhabditis briggsae]|uniref:glucuronosyltransferase n=1 Tax=Caenorhabditis briggsae TaxID=6238 RepID=A8X7J9_CAEBR|nr:Protein CBG08856 [Caenorhabditis briggsae]CAP28610.1 Protein CBG08856 [Caenorhabditis briggsae]
MADVIADHGHNVTLFQPFHIAMKNLDGLVKSKNIEIINYYPDHYEDLQKSEAQTFPVFWDSHLVNNPVLSSFMMPKMLANEFEKTDRQLYLDTNLHAELKSRKFDVAIAETFGAASFFFAHLLELPCIPIYSAVRFEVVNKLFGQPSALGYITRDGSKGAPDAGFLDRLSDVYRKYFDVLGFERIFQYQNELFQKTLGRPVPSWKDLITQSPVFITNSNPYLDFAVPTTATIVHVGGITMDLKKMKNVGPLPEEYEKILQERESTVLISFGSVIRSFQMPDNFKAGLIKMFESLPDVTFIWKYEKDDTEFQKKLPKNVHLKKWVPQPALLADHRVKVFVTHGGLGSTMEIAYTGKPALMVPIFGDQHHNALMLARHGGAVSYDKFDLPDGEKLTRTIKEIITNPKYQEKAQELLEILYNQPIDPKLNLMKHLEFAIQFPNLRSQVPEINQVGLIAHYYLDVVLFLASSSALAFYLLFKTLFQPFHSALKNIDCLVKNKNIEVLNYYPDHYEELLKTETETFPIFWDSPLANNRVLMALFMPKMMIGSRMAPTSGLWDRLNDLYMKFSDRVVMERIAKLQTKMIEGAIGRPVPYWTDPVKQSPLYITNSNPYLDFAVPTTATIVHVGGITMDRPEEYEKILQERESTVLISFGSNVRSFQMPENFKAGLIKMFESLQDVTFIWKYEKDDTEFQKKLPKNVHLKKWVPQPALLADHRVKVFVTHGGLGSTMEIAYTGKPALMVPIFGDQPQNAMMLARHGGAVSYDKFDLPDGEKLTRTIKEIITNPKYQEEVQELLEVLSNQPIDLKLNLMKHLEFAIQ